MSHVWKVCLSASIPLTLLAVLAVLALDPAGISAGAGRYKAGPNNTCVWDPNDNGPDQCKPADKRGRFKQEGDKCVWDPNDTGPNQCEPPKR
jgi:hypothetical protein